MIFPAPSALGLPAHFHAWREHQEGAFERAITSDKRAVAMVAPTGFGKTVTAESIAMYWGARTAYLVLTTALQVQIRDQFPHRYNVWGKRNYDCRLLIENDIDPANDAAKCDKAEALCDGCGYKEKGCEYYDAVRRARSEGHVLTNYAMWFAMNRYSEDGFSEFNGLIIDEAHNAGSQLCKALRIELSQHAVEQFTRRPIPAAQPISSWRDWSAGHAHKLLPRLEAMQHSAKAGHITGRSSWELRELKGLVSALQDLSSAADDWVEDRSDWAAKERVGFEPRWPAPYAERLLFRGIDKILLMSATLRPKHLEMLGLDMQRDVEFMEFPSAFPIARRPVIHVKTVQHRAGMTEGAKIEAVRRLDQVLSGRMDRKWLIDTVSFDRSEFIREHSKYAYFLIANSSGRNGLSAQDAMAQFKKAGAPRGLMGPSFRTGYDLPGALCELSVLYKVPFMDSRNPITKARREDDPLWEALEVMTEITQFFGRAMRADDDSNEGIVLDDQFVWFFWQCLQNGFVAPWFAPAVRLNQAIPKVLPKLPEHELIAALGMQEEQQEQQEQEQEEEDYYA